MSYYAPASRRRILILSASTALVAVLRGAWGGPLDRGIGGTGATHSDESDRGIGGTGVIGTIRKFGSIIVNDLRISYPSDATVVIDGRLALPADLKLGQVVRVNANARDGVLSTNNINVASEVVGKIERLGSQRITVLGQTVSTTSANRRSFKLGDMVAVSGLRRNDGTIVASLIEPRTSEMSRVAGAVAVADDGGLKIGTLKLVGLDPALIGQRVIAEGRSNGDRLDVIRAVAERSLLPNVNALSVESYVERRGDRIALGSGLAVEDAGSIHIPSFQSLRAVVNANVRADGRLSFENVRADGHTYGDAHGGSLSPRDGSEGAAHDDHHVPMDFNRGAGPSGKGFGSGSGGLGNGGQGGFSPPGALGGPPSGTGGGLSGPPGGAPGGGNRR